MKPFRVLFTVACLAVTAVAIACGPGFLDGISGGARDLTPDAEASAPPPADARACQPRRLPERPAGDDDKTSVSVPTLAFESLRIDTLGAADAGGVIPIGLDLDDRCTCPETDSCLRPTSGDAGQSCDGKNGEDNAMSSFFNAVNIGIPLFQQTFATDRIHEGFFTLLIDVFGWNGKDNDPNVAVTVRLSLQTEGAKTDGGFPHPKFDGTDVWALNPLGIAGGKESVGKDCRVAADSFRCIARVRDDHAYVRDGRLISRPRFDAMDQAPVSVVISAGVGTIDFNLLDFTLYGSFNRGEDGGVSGMAGELTGRVSASNVLHTIGSLDDFTTDKDMPVCANPALYAVAKGSVCQTPDLAAPGKDNTGAKCDHVSVAMSFAASPATVGPIVLRESAAQSCDESIFTCP